MMKEQGEEARWAQAILKDVGRGSQGMLDGDGCPVLSPFTRSSKAVSLKTDRKASMPQGTRKSEIAAKPVSSSGF